MNGIDPSAPAPLTAGRFRIEIEGVAAGGFAACSGLEGAAAFLTIREGGSESPRLFRGGVQWQPIRLERGFSSSPELWSWFQSGEPRNGSVVLLSADGSEAGRWIFSRGRPARWSAPSLDAREEGVALEAVEIVHEGLQCVIP
ncbi:MAG: phage tail protein [Planctomycetes bacterium]|nr:phage tail protein [Planctomycetota bacterium]